MRKELREPVEINGVTCVGLTVYNDNGTVHASHLARDLPLACGVLPTGSKIFFDANGKIGSCFLRTETLLQGHLCKAGDPWAVRFYPGGKLQNVWLARDEEIDGVPCASGSAGQQALRAIGAGPGVHNVWFFENGRLWFAKLSRDATIQGHAYKKGEIIHLDAQGQIDLLADKLTLLDQRIVEKSRRGRPAEKDLAPELAGFDALLTEHAGEKTDEVALILFRKARLYGRTLGNNEKAIALLKQLIAEFPDTASAKDAEPVIAQLERQPPPTK